MTPLEAARLGVEIANTMERSGSPTAAGVVHGLAVTVVELVREVETLRRSTTGSACPQCGGHVEQPDHGRRRRFCSTRCRQAHHRDGKRRNAEMDA